MTRSMRILAAAAIVGGQLLATLVGAAGVMCVGPGGHAAIELEHGGVCDELSETAGGWDSSAGGVECSDGQSNESVVAIAGVAGAGVSVSAAGSCEDSELSLSSAELSVGRADVLPDVAAHLLCGTVEVVAAETYPSVGRLGESSDGIRAGPEPWRFVELLI